MQLTMENSRFRVAVEMLGAELASILDKGTGREYLWQGDPAVWPHKAPVLFPVCGPLLGDRVEMDGQEYQMPRGGFALRLRHKLVCQDKGLICLRLESTPESEAIYPWRFAVKTTYALKGNHISCRMKVLNYDRKTMYFQCGFLTAFNCPFVSGTTQADYGLRLEQLEALTVQEQDDKGFLTRNTQMWEPEDGVIFLDSGKLDSGLVIREPTSQYFQFSCKKSGEYVRLYTREAPFVYLRAAPAGERRFLCMGSWHGAPDLADASASWEKKENVISLGAMEEYYAHQTIEIGSV
ncbi:MAG: hypothetical protein HFF13_00255 [Angelakisella sp.]|nr:hypothetical protein [Angelakisella sp.]